MTHINRKIIITIDGEKGQSGKTLVEITENGKPKNRFEWTEATFTSLILMEIATDILCACHEDMMKHWMKYNHVPDSGEKVEEEHIADVSNMMEQQGGLKVKYIDAEKLIAEIKRQRDGAIERQNNLEKIGQKTVLNEMLALKLNRLLSFIASLTQERQMPDSTQLIAEWEKEKAVLEQKDFRGDAERMAYNAFLDGFVKGLGYEGTK